MLYTTTVGAIRDHLAELRSHAEALPTYGTLTDHEEIRPMPTLEPMTMRTDITMEEHNLLMAVRQLRDAEAAQEETAAALVKAENDNVDAEWELDDAKDQYEAALENAKAPTRTYDWAAGLRDELTSERVTASYAHEGYYHD